MNGYQAIYDAVRSRISNGNVGDAISEIARQSFDISHALAVLTQDFSIVAMEQQRPFVLLKPKISRDGDEWCFLYGENLQDGIAGFGDTPEKASRDFDTKWKTVKPDDLCHCGTLYTSPNNEDGKYCNKCRNFK